MIVPVFHFLPFETLISKKQKEYYAVLSACDKAGNSTVFIKFILMIIDEALGALLDYKARTMTRLKLIEYYLSIVQTEFNRKDYMNLFKDQRLIKLSFRHGLLKHLC